MQEQANVSVARLTDSPEAVCWPRRAVS